MNPKVLKHDKLTLERIEKFISKKYFTDYNLHSKHILYQADLKGLWSATCESLLPFTPPEQFTKAHVGDSFGPSWKTVWFKVEGVIPEEWQGHAVWLLWESDGEATVWRDGKPVQGLSKEAYRTTYLIYDHFTQTLDSIVTLTIEMSCNALFGVGESNIICPPDENRMFKLSKAQLVVFNMDIQHLIIDFDLLHQISQELEGQRGKQAMFTANEMMNIIVVNNFKPGALKKARRMGADFFEQKNGESQHTLHLVANCHLDTAWLWPLKETVRKCCRSFSTTLSLIHTYPHFTFALSQAQQVSWMKEYYPSVFEGLKREVERGRVQLVGGLWVEMDANLPSGESMIRQFIKGQQFFKREFGVVCKQFWLPDTFGYSAQLPQIMRGCGVDRFVTQKISWNFFNKFPHHTFWWHGIDDSKVLVHFPPGDSYGMQVKVAEMLKTVKNNEDQGRLNHSLFLYGHGDGGQGPTEDMLEKLQRLRDVDGLPKACHSNVDLFFDEVCKASFPYQGDRNEMLCDWRGELFLELHNGTYTSQALMKKCNKQFEKLMHLLECLLASLLLDHPIMKDKVKGWMDREMDELWKLVLLNQFHDILPGSGISMVYEDAKKTYEDVAVKAGILFQKLGGQIWTNTLSWEKTAVVRTSVKGEHFKQPCKLHPHEAYCLVRWKGLLSSCSIITPQHHCTLSSNPDGSFKLSNGILSAVVDAEGRVKEMYEASSSRNALKGDGNRLVVYDDVPLFWDAWDVMPYHAQTGVVQCGVEEMAVVEDGPLRIVLKVRRKIGEQSKMWQFIVLDADSPFLVFQTEVDWKESHKLLKAEFQTNVLCRNATYGIQFGCLERPNHNNTSRDMAQNEVCGHEWADVSEEGFGVAVLSKFKFGWSCNNNTLCLSLLRSSKSPDANADMGLHNFEYALMPHLGRWQEAGVVRAARNFNESLPIDVKGIQSDIELPLDPVSPLMQIDHPAIVLSAFKPAEAGDGRVVVRMYESHGGSCTVQISFRFHVSSVTRCNMLEEAGQDVEVKDNRHARVHFDPFQVVTLLICKV